MGTRRYRRRPKPVPWYAPGKRIWPDPPHWHLGYFWNWRRPPWFWNTWPKRVLATALCLFEATMALAALSLIWEMLIAP